MLNWLMSSMFVFTLYNLILPGRVGADNTSVAVVSSVRVTGKLEPYWESSWTKLGFVWLRIQLRSLVTRE